jgi:hypothetical protein
MSDLDVMLAWQAVIGAIERTQIDSPGEVEAVHRALSACETAYQFLEPIRTPLSA